MSTGCRRCLPAGHLLHSVYGLIADFAVVARGLLVHHLMHDGRLTPHTPAPGVRLRGDGLLAYDDGSAPR